MRAPPCEFLLRGPPSGLRQQLQTFGKRTAACRQEAEALITALGLDSLHFSEMLASAFYDLSIGLGLEEIPARLVAHFAEAEPGPLQSNQCQKRLTRRMFALILRAQDQRRLRTSDVLMEHSE